MTTAVDVDLATSPRRPRLTGAEPLAAPEPAAPSPADVPVTTEPPVTAAPPRADAGVAAKLAPAAGFAAIDQLLRDREALLDRIERGRDLRGLARTMLLSILVSAGVFGAALGLYRGGAQVAFAALKLPLAILLTAALVAPATSALRRVVEGATSMRRDVALVLASLALGSLVIAALAPVVTLAVCWGAFYHTVVVLAVACCAAGGAVGLSFFVRGTRTMARGGRAVVVGTTLLLVALVGAQMAWTARPWIVRPRTPDVPIVRRLEGGFLDAVVTASASAVGVYARPEAPLPEALPAAVGASREAP
jgi:hypothetical protein